MKKILLSLSLLFNVLASFAQSVYEQVNFDSPSDQSTYFSGMQTLVQISNNGITGGCLQTPDSSNWGNDNSIYCSKYMAVDSTLNTTQIRFFYSDSVINVNSYDRAASIWLKPFADPNHYVIGSFTHDKKLEILSYFTAHSSAAQTMINNHWYRLTLETQVTANDVHVVISLTDMGTAGTSAVSFPILDGVSFTDSLFAHDNAIDVSIGGSKAGGCIYIDNFTFEGYKSSASCPATGVQEIKNTTSVNLIPDGNFQRVVSDANISYYEIFELSGKKIRHEKLNSDKLIDVSGISPGIYFFRFDGNGKALKICLN